VISWVDIAVLVVGVLSTAAYSGSEIAFYSVSRARIDVEARQGVRSSRIIRSLLSDDIAFLIVVLIGNTLMVELMTWSAEELMRGWRLPNWAMRTVLSVVLTPFLFIFCEVLPKDFFRRRPHALLSRTAPFVLVSRWIFWPLERLLYLLTRLLDWIFRVEPRLHSVVRGREAVLRLLSEGAREGAILPHAEQMARNVLKLRSIEVERCMIPWNAVQVLRAEAPQDDLYDAVARSPHTRIPVVEAGGACRGYVHQLDVLGEGDGTPVLDQLMPVTVLPSGTSVDRALARLRSAGQRLAIVGEAASPKGLVTLKDLLEEISGDLAGW
jgi:CBS domain containing-hemolysin-like protein